MLWLNTAVSLTTSKISSTILLTLISPAVRLASSIQWWLAASLRSVNPPKISLMTKELSLTAIADKIIIATLIWIILTSHLYVHRQSSPHCHEPLMKPSVKWLGDHQKAIGLVRTYVEISHIIVIALYRGWS